MTATDPLGPAATMAALSSITHPLGDLVALPAVSGLYAWWAAQETLPHLPGPAHPHHDDLRLLYISGSPRTCDAGSSATTCGVAAARPCAAPSPACYSPSTATALSAPTASC